MTTATTELKASPGDVVRVVANAGGVQLVAYAHVLTLSPIFPELVGTKGEPALSVVFIPGIDPGIAASRAGWEGAFNRVATVKHVTHPDVVARKEAFYYLDVLPPAGEAISLPEVSPLANPNDAGEKARAITDGVGTGPVAVAAPATTTPTETVKSTVPVGYTTSVGPSTESEPVVHTGTTEPVKTTPVAEPAKPTAEPTKVEPEPAKPATPVAEPKPTEPEPTKVATPVTEPKPAEPAKVETPEPAKPVVAEPKPVVETKPIEAAPKPETVEKPETVAAKPVEAPKPTEEPKPEAK